MALIKRHRWLSPKQTVERLGIEGTAKTPATEILAAMAEEWGILKVPRSNKPRSGVAYVEASVDAYMARREAEAIKKLNKATEARTGQDQSDEALATEYLI